MTQEKGSQKEQRSRPPEAMREQWQEFVAEYERFNRERANATAEIAPTRSQSKTPLSDQAVEDAVDILYQYVFSPKTARQLTDHPTSTKHDLPRDRVEFLLTDICTFSALQSVKKGADREFNHWMMARLIDKLEATRSPDRELTKESYTLLTPVWSLCSALTGKHVGNVMFQLKNLRQAGRINDDIAHSAAHEVFLNCIRPYNPGVDEAAGFTTYYGQCLQLSLETIVKAAITSRGAADALNRGWGRDQRDTKHTRRLPLSLDRPVDQDSGTTFGDMMSDDEAHSPLYQSIIDEETQRLEDALRKLEPRAANALRMYIDGHKKSVLREIMNAIGGKVPNKYMISKIRSALREELDGLDPDSAPGKNGVQR